MSHLVYVVSDGQWVKVGFTTDIKTRLRQLQNANGRSLDVLTTFPCGSEREARHRERRIRRAFAWRTGGATRGEWVEATPESAKKFFRLDPKVPKAGNPRRRAMSPITEVDHWYADRVAQIAGLAE